MYGVMVVPTTATSSSSCAGARSRCGVTSALPDRAPVGIGQDRREDVGEEHDDDRQEDALDRPIAGLDDERPDGHADDRHDDVARDPEHLERRRRAGELGHRVGDVGDQQDGHRERRRAHPEPVADEVRQALPGDHAEPGRHLLDDGQDDDRDREDPQQGQPGLGAHHAVGRDPARVVAGDPGDQPRPHDGQERDQPAPAAEPPAQAQDVARRPGARAARVNGNRTGQA